MIEILLLLGGVCCLCALVIGAMVFLSRAEGDSGGGTDAGDVVLSEEQSTLLKALRREKSKDVIESGMLTKLYPGAKVITSKSAGASAPSNGFLLLEDNAGRVVNVKASGTIKDL